MPTKQTSLLNGWSLEEEFAQRLKKKTGFGSRVTLARWRRLNTVPKEFEWKHAGRAVMWREKPEPSEKTASPA
jgi:hypothetical protein